MFAKLWNDEAGFVVSAELIFVATLLVIGLVAGWVAVRNAVTSELGEVAGAIAAVNQSYSYSGIDCCVSAASGGANVTDTAGVVSIGFAGATPAQSINVSVCP